MSALSAFTPFDQAAPWSDRTHTLECVSAVPEGRDTATFTFKATGRKDGWFRYLPGQFVTLELPTPEGTVLRTYTLSSTPSRPLTIAVTVKAQAASIGTRWMLDHLKPGTALKAYGPAGAFSFHHHPAEKYLFIAAGSGITPMMSMARFAEDYGKAVDIAFVNCARRPADLLFRHELERMAARLPQLRLAWLVEDADPGEVWTGYRGRLSAPALALIAPDFREREVFCCGPAPFMQAVRTMLDARGFDLAHYHEESFQPAEPEPTPIPKGEAGSVVFTLSGVEAEAAAGETILQLARNSGLGIPTGCTMGLCGTCRVRRVSGRTDMTHSGGIREEDVEAGYVLACCTRPLGRVEIEA